MNARRSENHNGDRAGRRQFVKFSFYRVDAEWRRLPPVERDEAEREFCRAVEAFGGSMIIRTYSLAGTRADADFLIWQISDSLDEIQRFATAVLSTRLGSYLNAPYSFLAMTRRSVYASPEQRDSARLAIRPSEARYLFVYPFVKTRVWYALSQEERQALMNEHIAVGRKYPTVKLNTTYSFGLDDQEFVVAFETDEPADFLDLVMELRETRASAYTLRDTPIFTCTAMPLPETIRSLGGIGETLVETSDASAPSAPRPEWVKVAELWEVPEGGAKLVYLQGEEVALFNAGGWLFAVENRCSHSNGPLCEGTLEEGLLTCPWHESRFDPATGEPLGGPATRRLKTYEVRIENENVYLSTIAKTPQATAR